MSVQKMPIVDSGATSMNGNVNTHATPYIACAMPRKRMFVCGERREQPLDANVDDDGKNDAHH